MTLDTTIKDIIQKVESLQNSATNYSNEAFDIIVVPAQETAGITETVSEPVLLDRIPICGEMRAGFFEAWNS